MLLTCELELPIDSSFGFWIAISDVCIHILNFELNLCGVAERQLSVCHRDSACVCNVPL